jgi:hypothetical protein
MASTNLLIFTVVSVLLIQWAESLDMESAKERPCSEPPKTIKPDLAWVMSVKKWYWVLGSRFDLYEFASDILEKDPKLITEDELYYKSCVDWQLGSDGSLVAHGFGSKQKSYAVKPLDEHFGTIQFSSVDDGTVSGVGYATLTDNKTFLFYVTCYKKTNQLVWNVASPYKSLSKKTIKLIHDHAESHGFKREYFTGLRYDSCDKDGEGKEEL